MATARAINNALRNIHLTQRDVEPEDVLTPSESVAFFEQQQGERRLRNRLALANAVLHYINTDRPAERRHAQWLSEQPEPPTWRPYNCSHCKMCGCQLSSFDRDDEFCSDNCYAADEDNMSDHRE